MALEAVLLLLLGALPSLGIDEELLRPGAGGAEDTHEGHRKDDRARDSRGSHFESSLVPWRFARSAWADHASTTTTSSSTLSALLRQQVRVLRDMPTDSRSRAGDVHQQLQQRYRIGNIILVVAYRYTALDT